MTKKYCSILLVFLALSFLAAIFTYSLVFRFSNTIYGYPGDSFAYLNYLWRFKEGLPFDAGLPAPLLDSVIKFLTLLFGEVVAYNLLAFLRIPLAGLAMYFLCRRILHQVAATHGSLDSKVRHALQLPQAAAFIAGFIFSFSLYSLWQGMVHIDLALIVWLPVFVLCLLNLWEKPNFKNALWVAIIFSFTTLTSFYYGYFLALFSGGFFIFGLVSKIVWRTKVPFLRFLVSGLLSLLFISPFIYPIFMEGGGQASIAETIESRGPEQLVSLGAKPWDYLMPSIYHPVFGRWVERFYDHNQEKVRWYFHSAYLPERVVFLGFTPIVLALLGFWWGRKDGRFKKYVWLFGFLALWCAWISAPSYTFIKGVKVYFPSYLLYEVFPMFRVYARMGILVLLCVAILASIGLVLSIEKLQRCRIAKGKKILISCLPPEALAKVGLLFSVFTLILFEDLNFPPFHVTDVSLRPPVYQWLTSRPRDSKIIEYPVDTSGNDFGGGCPEWLDPETRREYPGYYSALFQRIHRKEILDYGKLPNEEKSALIDLSKSDAYEVLSLHGVDYIIIHAKDYFPQGNPFDECQERRIMERPEEVYEGFELIEEFEDAVVYRLMNDKF